MGKVPFIDIPLSNLELDEGNPRIIMGNNPSQEEILKLMYKKHALNELALSMKINGYINIEPIIVIPKKLPKNFDKIKDDPVEFQKFILKQISNGGKFIVLEGNRRISTAKLIVNPELREAMGISNDNYNLDKGKLKTFGKITTNCFSHREDVSSYIGIRHINSNLKWTSFAKAVYIKNRIEEFVKNGQNIANAINSLELEIGDSTQTIRKFYFCYRIALEAKENTDFDINPITENFSLMTNSLPLPIFRKYVGITETISTLDYSKDNLIEDDFYQNLEELLTWIFGNKELGKDKVITESRDLIKLRYVLANDISKNHLVKYKNLEEAYEYTNGEEEYVNRKLVSVIRYLREISAMSYTIKNPEEVLESIAEIEAIINTLSRSLKK